MNSHNRGILDQEVGTSNDHFRHRTECLEEIQGLYITESLTNEQILMGDFSYLIAALRLSEARSFESSEPDNLQVDVPNGCSIRLGNKPAGGVPTDFDYCVALSWCPAGGGLVTPA